MDNNTCTNVLAEQIEDNDIIEYYYLGMKSPDVLNKINSLSFTLLKNSKDMPFNAQVKGYLGTKASDESYWLVKPIPKQEVFYHRQCELAYLLDCEMETLASPTIVVKIDEQYYRATKVVANAVQISSYNYVENPYKSIIATDLVNRWLFFDEDRNPNNYMVIHNKKCKPFVVAIDYDKCDLLSEEMKILGEDAKFGWIRKEKTRFLTLLRPEHFDNCTLEDFDRRLELMMGIPVELINKLALDLFRECVENPEEKAGIITQNLIRRREYINSYFRKWFQNKDPEKSKEKENEYANFGQSFLNFYQKKS